MDKRIKPGLALILLAASAMPALADGGDSSKGSRLAPFQELIEQEKYQHAIDQLTLALEKKPDDADLLNLIAYSHRKLDRLDAAMSYYQKAIAIDPGHRGANEYLGELYLRLGQLDKARERLAVLDSECFFGCEEYDDLKKAIAEYVKKNSS